MSTTAARTALIDRLKQAQREQTKVAIHFRGTHFEGAVCHIENDLIQLRHTDGKISHIVIDNIDAITTE